MNNISNSAPRQTPGHKVLDGRFVRVEPLDWDIHGTDLYAAVSGAAHDALWSYMTIGPFDNVEAFKSAMQASAQRGSWQTMASCDPVSGKAVGSASYMRLRENFGSAEVGCVIFGPALKQSRAATEAMYLMAQHGFDDLDYRRYEWKCDNQNAPSKSVVSIVHFQFI